ncbi:hypothetical protein [Arsukibacterium indicum]|uniref:Tip attachment protein J domain-containing protein n=1 Tax=Arsukibacterium indicum TaxID=2848612 RepID=A0ABS6MGP6_9GAMM|nr:hypothetical protein [Arsukibacterium indicum]MBV2127915.1 hypothetical protein [Arsukibacterium indicum]
MTAITLRFQYRAYNTTSPVILRFGIAPPAVILEPNLIMAFSAPYSRRAGLINRAFKTSWASGDITKAVNVRWSSNPVTIKLVYSTWQSSPRLVTQQAGVDWSSNWPIVDQHLSVNWGGYQLLITQAETSWENWPIVSQQLQTTWLPTLPLYAMQTAQHWRHTAITEQFIDVFYNYKPDLIRGYTLPYGPRPPSYICSNDARPTRGKITLRFYNPGENTSGPVTLRFSNANNPIICVLDNGGGLIWPMPDLPTIDITKPITPPRRRSYIMQPALRCYRVSDNQEVNIISASYGISRSQWGANISLVCGSKGDKDLLFAPGPQEFKLVINGYEFFGLAEDASVSSRFGKNTYTVTGRSNIAELAAPNAAPRSYSNATAKGIAALVTDELGASGWSLDYGPAQFNVPAGVFSYQNKTPIEAIAQIAAAVGAMIYTDGATKTLYIAPLWPVTPWAIDSATPDIAVHDDVILQYSSQPAKSPLFNKIIVRGEQQGNSVGVRRTGTAGDKLAPEVVEALITAELAARQRGTAELAESGNKDSITLVLPIMDLLPPCQPGLILGVTWQTNVFKALVDSLQISAQRSPDGKLTVRQNVGMLRSYE